MLGNIESRVTFARAYQGQRVAFAPGIGSGLHENVSLGLTDSDWKLQELKKRELNTVKETGVIGGEEIEFAIAVAGLRGDLTQTYRRTEDMVRQQTGLFQTYDEIVRLGAIQKGGERISDLVKVTYGVPLTANGVPIGGRYNSREPSIEISDPQATDATELSALGTMRKLS